MSRRAATAVAGDILRRVAADDESAGRAASRLALAGFMTGAGVLHFLVPGAYDRLVPAWTLVGPVDDARVWTLASGAAEVASGVLLAARSTRRVGALVAAATLVGVFPANVDAAVRGGMPVDGWLGSEAAAWLRLPLQLPLVAWAWAHWRRPA